MMKIIPKRILAIGAHPDDVELGCFGTLARMRNEGAEIAIFIATCGGVGGDVEMRRAEAVASAKLLGVTPVFGDLPDTAIPDGHPTIGLIEKMIADFKPEVVFTHSPNDMHQDHRNISRATVSASRFVPIVLFHQTPSSTRQFKPDLYVSITGFLDKKLEALRLHKTQGKNVYMADKAITGLAEYRGFELYKGGEAFEGFEVHQMIV